jgi:hypothetical protein
MAFNRKRYWGGDLDLGLTDHGKRLLLREEQRALHMQVIGLSGKGKTSAVSSLVRQDILNKQGAIVIDPHGALYNDLVAFCAQYRLHQRRRIRLLNPSEERFRMGLNPLRIPPGHHVSGVVDAVMSAFEAVWGDEDFVKTPRLQRILYLVCYVLAAGRHTLCEAHYFLRSHDPDGLRKYLTSSIEHDPLTGAMYEAALKELEALRGTEFWNQVESTFNRFFRFLASPVINTILGQKENVLDVRRSMDDGEVILVNLAPNVTTGFSSVRARVLGNLLVSTIFNAALSRTPNTSRPFYVYIDECYDYLTKDIEKILDQARKFGVHLVLIHQGIRQLRDKGEAIESGVMEGAQTKIVFGLGRKDALEMGYDLFGEQFDLEKPKRSLIRPTPVGEELVLLRSASRSRGRNRVKSRTAGVTESESEDEGFSETTTFAEGSSWASGSAVGKGVSFVERDGQVSPWGGYEGLRTLSSFETESESAGGSSMNGSSSGYTRRTSRGHATHESESNAEGTDESDTEGTAEAYRKIWKNLPTATYSLDELKHLASVELSRLRQRQAFVKIPNAPPIKIVADCLQPGLARQERIEGTVTQMHASCEYTVEYEIIHQELVQRPQQLARLAAESRHEQAASKLAEEPDLDDTDLTS